MKRAIEFVTCVGAVLCLWMATPKHVAADQLTTSTVTFNREIVGMLNNHCVMCHTENGLSFPLETYEQTFFKGKDIRDAVMARHMPPWSAVPGYGDFVNSNAMNFREVQSIVSWVDGAGPRTNGSVFLNVFDSKAEAPVEIKAHADFGRWELGQPDLLAVVALSKGDAATAGASTQAIVDPKLATDRWIRGFEYKPGDRKNVRAASFTIRETGQWLGTWTPWYGFVSLPQGVAYRLPAGAQIVAEIYTGDGKSTVADGGSLGLYFAVQPSTRNVTTMTLQMKSDVSFNAKTQRRTAVMKLVEDTQVMALWPKLQPGGQSIEVDARTADGQRQVLLFARDMHTDWPTSYILKHPVMLTKGTEIAVVEYGAGAGEAAKAPDVLIVNGYQGAALASQEPKASEVKPAAPVQRFKLAGVIRSVDEQSHSMVIQHGAIPGFMGSMTMSYRAESHEDFSVLKAGDEIQADVVVSDSDTYLENIKITGHAK